MATQRLVNTNFWKDSYITDLDPIEKLLFLYFITNPNTNIAGIYEISLRQIAFDTGIDKDMVQKIIDRFVRDGKVYYKRNWLALHNWIRHQSMNPKVTAGIQRIIDEIPEWLHKELIDPDDPQQSLLNDENKEPIHSLSKPIALNLTKLNLTKLNETAEAEISKKTNKKQYVAAIEADKELSKKEIESRSRSTSNGYKSFTTIGDALKSKNL